MAFMLLALRPAAVALLQPPERLMMMGAVWKRFFPIVLVSIVALLTTGTNLYTGFPGNQGGNRTRRRAARVECDAGVRPADDGHILVTST